MYSHIQFYVTWTNNSILFFSFLSSFSGKGDYRIRYAADASTEENFRGILSFSYNLIIIIIDDFNSIITSVNFAFHRNTF